MARRWRQGVSHCSCWCTVLLNHAKSPLVSAVAACFVFFVNWWRRKAETVRWWEVLVSRICLAVDRTSCGPSAQLQVLIHQYYGYNFTTYLAPCSIKNRQCSSNFELWISCSNFLLQFFQPSRLYPCGGFILFCRGCYHCSMLWFALWSSVIVEIAFLSNETQ